MGMGGIIDFLFLGCGVYLIWISISAKRQGKIVADVMLGKNISESHIKDKVGFLEFMCKRLLLAGVLIMIGSTVHLVNDYYVGSAALTCVGILLILSALVIYARAYSSGQKRYIMQNGGHHKDEK